MNRKRTRGCRGGTHLMPVAFRDYDARTIRDVQHAYATGFYTQRMLAEASGLTLYIIGRACRVAGVNVARVRAQLEVAARLAGLKLRKRTA